MVDVLEHLLMNEGILVGLEYLIRHMVQT